MPPDKVFRDTELGAEFSNFVFEEFTQRFNQLQFHDAGEPAHVVVGFDRLRGAFEGDGFNDVWVKGALEEPFYVTSSGRVGGLFLDLLGGVLKDFDEVPADDLSLLFWVFDAFEVCEEFGLGVYYSQIDPQVLRQSLVDDLGFTVVGQPPPRPKAWIFSAYSSRSNPLSTRTAWKRSPIASFMIFAATVESTPPVNCESMLALIGK